VTDQFPDGVLVIDKPAGPTSHDIVAVAPRDARQESGAYGTLDPLALRRAAAGLGEGDAPGSVSVERAKRNTWPS